MHHDEFGVVHSERNPEHPHQFVADRNPAKDDEKPTDDRDRKRAFFHRCSAIPAAFYSPRRGTDRRPSSNRAETVPASAPSNPPVLPSAMQWRSPGPARI